MTGMNMATRSASHKPNVQTWAARQVAPTFHPQSLDLNGKCPFV